MERPSFSAMFSMGSGTCPSTNDNPSVNRGAIIEVPFRPVEMPASTGRWRHQEFRGFRVEDDAEAMVIGRLVGLGAGAIRRPAGAVVLEPAPPAEHAHRRPLGPVGAGGIA